MTHGGHERGLGPVELEQPLRCLLACHHGLGEDAGEPVLLGHVVGDADEPDEVAVGVASRVHRDRGDQPGAVGACERPVTHLEEVLAAGGRPVGVRSWS